MADSVFYDLADTADEAANLTARGLLMIAIERRIKEKAWTQTEAAARLHVTQPRVSDLLNGKIDKFSLDALVNMLAPVDLTFEVRSIDRPAARGQQEGRIRRESFHEFQRGQAHCARHALTLTSPISRWPGAFTPKVRLPKLLGYNHFGDIAAAAIEGRARRAADRRPFRPGRLHRRETSPTA